jgi:hypothetical protein
MPQKDALEAKAGSQWPPATNAQLQTAVLKCLQGLCKTEIENRQSMTLFTSRNIVNIDDIVRVLPVTGFKIPRKSIWL